MATTDLQTRNPLFQQDLFLCILDYLVPPEADFKQFREARRALFSLARTCHAFSEPSLDRLWYKLNSLKPLVMCYLAQSSEEREKVLLGYSSSSLSSLTASIGIGTNSERMGHHPSVFPPHQRTRHQPVRPVFSVLLRVTSLHPSFLVPNLMVFGWHPPPYPQPHYGSSIIFIQRLLRPSLDY